MQPKLGVVVCTVLTLTIERDPGFLLCINIIYNVYKDAICIHLLSTFT